MNVTDKRHWADIAGWLLGILVLLAYALYTAFLEGGRLAFNPLNGQFQNYNSLVRLAAGEVPYRDFPLYLGAAAAFIPLPLFCFLGGTLSAANMATGLVSFAMTGGAFMLMLRLAGVRPAMAYPLAAALTMLPWPMTMGWNSAIGIRSALPFLAAALTGLLLVCRLPLVLRFALGGILVGGMPLWSNDYGLPTALMTGFVVLAQAPRGLKPLLLASMTFALAVASGFCLAAMVLAGGPGPWLTFTTSVAQDQFWYFNPAVASKVFSLTDIRTDAVTALAALSCATVCLVWLARHPRNARWSMLAILSGASVGGWLVSGLGGTFEIRYALPLWRTGLVMLPFLAFQVWRLHRPRKEVIAERRRYDPAVLSFLGGGQLCLLVGLLFGVPIASQMWGQRVQPDDVQAAELGGVIPREYAPALEFGRALRAEFDADGKPAGARLLSTYSTMLTVLTGSRNHLPDYIIHALGPKLRSDYVQALDGPVSMVETSDPGFMSWGIWSYRTSWEFHRKLLHGWEVSGWTPYSTLWRRSAEERTPRGAMACSVKQEGDWLRLDVARPGDLPAGEAWWMDVHVQVRAQVRKGNLPLLGGRAVLELQELREGESPLNIPPDITPNEMSSVVSRVWTAEAKSGELSFPLAMAAGVHRGSVALRAYPGHRASLSLYGCEARPVAPMSTRSITPAGEGEIQGILSLKPTKLRPERYYFGAEEAAIYLAPVNAFDTTRLSVGDTIRFSDGSEAKVLTRYHGMLAVTVPDILPEGLVEKVQFIKSSR